MLFVFTAETDAESQSVSVGADGELWDFTDCQGALI